MVWNPLDRLENIFWRSTSIFHCREFHSESFGFLYYSDSILRIKAPLQSLPFPRWHTVGNLFQRIIHLILVVVICAHQFCLLFHFVGKSLGGPEEFVCLQDWRFKELAILIVVLKSFQLAA